VLVLSQFAGSASELDNSVIVNPHEIESVAVALKRALEMPLMERRERHATMLQRLMDWDIDTWAESYLSALVKSHSRRAGFDGIRSLFGMMSEQRPLPTEGSFPT
jgi:trehalose 6-phosphate synthase